MLEMGLLIVVQHLLKSISHLNWKLLEMAMHQMNKKKDEILNVGRIGQGGFGKVKKVKWRGEMKAMKEIEFVIDETKMNSEIRAQREILIMM